MPNSWQSPQPSTPIIQATGAKAQPKTGDSESPPSSSSAADQWPAERPVDERDERDECDQHRDDVEPELQPVLGSVGRRLDHVVGRALDAELDLAAGDRLLGLGLHDLRDQEGGRAPT